MRTNCIDSLDRTNFAQEIFGYIASLKQLKALGVIEETTVQLKSQFFKLIFDMYNKMGDSISMQYGGSIAHHAQMGKKKSFGLNEVWTSIIRHYNNVYIDPDRQRVINLFLGIYKPLFHKVAIWNITDEENHKGNYKRVVKLNHIQGTKWWVPYVEEFENDLPAKFKRS